MIADAKQIKSINEAFKNKSPIFFHGDNVDITFQTRIKDIRDNILLLENTVHPDFISSMVDASRFSVQINMLKFETDEIQSDGKNIIFPLKYDDSFEDSRMSERVNFTSDERVYCEFINPYDHVTILRKKVVDMSNTGICIKNSINSGLFQPGTHFTDLTIYIDSDSFFTTSGAVIYVRKLMSKNSKLENQIGIKFDSKIENVSKLEPL